MMEQEMLWMWVACRRTSRTRTRSGVDTAVTGLVLAAGGVTVTRGLELIKEKEC